MIVAISALGSLPSIRPLANIDLGSVGGVGSVGNVGGMSPTSGTDFAGAVTNALESVTQKQNVADGVSQQASLGRLQDVHEFTIATTEASLATELTVAVRNRALEAYNTIMQMGV